MNEILYRLKDFLEYEARSCSMDFGCVTPEYVYRMWGGSVAIEQIASAMNEIKKGGQSLPGDGNGTRTHTSSRTPVW